MKNFSRIILAILLVAALSFAAVANAAPAQGGHIETDQPSLFQTGNMMAGIGFLGYWAGGIDLMGSYFFTDNIAAQVDFAPLTYNYIGGSVNVMYMDLMGVYHMAFADNLGAYFGLGLGMGSATYTIAGFQQTISVGGFAYTAGVEMLFNENIRANLGVTSGGLGAGVSMIF